MSKYPTLEVADSQGTLQDITYNSAKLERFLRGFNVLTVRLDFTQRSNLGGDREVILRDGNTRLFRGFTRSGGKETTTGEILLKADQQGLEIAETQISQSLSSTTNVDVIEDSVSGTNYSTVNTPAGATTYNISSYSNKKDRKRAWVEMNRFYDYQFYLDPNGEWNYEPTGYFNSGETFTEGDTSTPGVIKDYEPEVTEQIVNKVEVVGVDSNGNKVTGTASNIGANEPERFRRYKVGYVESQSEADTIASQLLRPNSTDRIILQVNPTYTSNLINELYTVKSTNRGIDDDFVVKKQVDYYPADRTILNLGISFEDEGILNADQQEQELRDERARLIRETQQDVGQQNAGTLANDTAEADNTTSENNKDPGVQGNTDDSNVDTEFDIINTTETLSDGESANLTANLSFVSGNTDFTIFHVFLSTGERTSSTLGYDLDLTNDDTGDNYLTLDQVLNTFSSFSTSVLISGDVEGDDVTLEIQNNTGGTETVGYGFSASQIAEHNHGSSALNADSHAHDVVTSDQGHGGSGDPSEHTIDGSTDSKNINVGSEDDTSR